MAFIKNHATGRMDWVKIQPELMCAACNISRGYAYQKMKRLYERTIENNKKQFRPAGWVCPVCRTAVIDK